MTKPKKTGKENSHKKEKDEIIADPGERLIMTDDDQAADSVWSDLFGDGNENVEVLLYRTEPEYLGSDNILGFLSMLLPGDGLETIRRKYGGGKYKIQKKVNSRIKKTGHIRISGLPRMPIREDDLDDLEKVAPPETKVPEGAAYKGIPISGNTAEFVAMIERIKLLEVAFPQKPDVNDVLLKVALDRRSDGGGDLSSLLAQAEQVGALVDRLGGRDQTGSSLVDLGMKAMDSLKEYLKFVGAGGAQPKSPAVNRSPGPGVSLEKPTGITLVRDDKKKEIRVEKTPDNNMMGVPEKAAGVIIRGFLLDPRQDPPETVRVLRELLPAFGSVDLSRIKDNRNLFYAICRNGLSGEIDVDAEIGTELAEYFNRVFDLFVADPGRDGAA
jgi:hypothetical protein